MPLRSAGVVRLWQFETEVRADNDFTSFGYRKDYDAIVTFGMNGSSAQVALEYERTGKSTREYERICAELNLETRVSVFLYLARSLQLQSFLLHGFRMTTRRLYIGIFQEFCGDPRQVRLIDSPAWRDTAPRRLCKERRLGFAFPPLHCPPLPFLCPSGPAGKRLTGLGWASDIPGV